MELIPKIDKQIQIGLFSNGIAFPVDERGRITIHKYRIDTKACAGMLYILPKSELPKGKLPFLVILADYVYGVFYIDGKAAIIEISSMALDGDIEGWHVKNQI
jgi:hypothetical protein